MKSISKSHSRSLPKIEQKSSTSSSLSTPSCASKSKKLLLSRSATTHQPKGSLAQDFHAGRVSPQKVTYRHIGLDGNQKSAVQGLSDLSIKVQAVPKAKKGRGHTNAGMKGSKKAKKEKKSETPTNFRQVPQKQTLNFYRNKVQTQAHYPLQPVRHSTLPQCLLDRLETIQTLERNTYNDEMDHEEKRRKKKRETHEVLNQNDLVLPLSNAFIEQWGRSHEEGQGQPGDPVKPTIGLNSNKTPGSVPTSTLANLSLDSHLANRPGTSPSLTNLGHNHRPFTPSQVIQSHLNDRSSLGPVTPHGIAVFNTVANNLHGYEPGVHYPRSHSSQSHRYPEISKYLVASGGPNELRKSLVSREGAGRGRKKK